MTETTVSGQSGTDGPDTRQVFANEFAWVWRTLQRFGVRSADLEDVTHDVFVVFHARRQEYDSTRPIRPWLMGIAFRVASDYRRRASHRREVLRDEAEEPADSKPSPESASERAQRRRQLLSAFEKLDPDRLSILLLHDVDEVPVPEIARGMGIPLNTAYSRLRLARRDLAEALGHEKGAGK